MPAVGKEKGPGVTDLLAGRIDARGRADRAPGCRHAEQSAAALECKYEIAVAAPCAAAGKRYIGNRLSGAAVHVDPSQPAAGEKSDGLAVGGPEWLRLK